MRTIALRFGEQFAPECGTIASHQEVINRLGYVWYGKLGAAVSDKVISQIKADENPRILLIKSGKPDRYWAKVVEIQHEIPLLDEIPGYYRDTAELFRTWFKVVEIKPAPSNILKKCRVASSGNVLSEVSKHSMSPVFVIDVDE